MWCDAQVALMPGREEDPTLPTSTVGYCKISLFGAESRIVSRLNLIFLPVLVYPPTCKCFHPFLKLLIWLKSEETH